MTLSKNILLRYSLDCANMETELAGPWLASLTGDDAEAYVAGRGHAMLPCAIFWSCPDGDMVLWRRLRTINEILIPN